MLNRHYTAVLTLAILVTFGTTSKSVVSSDKVKSDSFLLGKITTLKEDSSVINSSSTINAEQIDSYTNNSQETILAQDADPEASSNGTSTDQNQSLKLWWLVPLIILVPLLGFLVLKSGSGSTTKQIDEEQISSDNRVDTVEASSPTAQNVTSEFAANSNVTDRLIQEDAQEDTNVEEIDNLSTEDSTIFQLLDDIQEQVENVDTASSEATKTQNESYEPELSSEDNPSWEESISTESFIEAEEIIDKSLAAPQSELASTEVEDQSLELNSIEELTIPETIAQSQSDALTTTEDMSAEIALEQTEQITDQDLANISEWLNEKIDSENKDVSVMDDFWDNLSSITEEISGEISSEEKEQITDRELANISEWLNEKVEPNYNLSDVANHNVDDLSDLVEGKEQDSNEELLNSRLNLEEDLEEGQTHKNKTRDGISDSTSNFLEELLNEDSNQESNH